MTILGIGVDLVEIERIRNLIFNMEERFIHRILTSIELLEYKEKRTEYFLAKHFAVKEAASKALGIGMRNKCAFHQFELYHDKFGKPSLRFLRRANRIASNIGVKNVFVTLTDERKYACAVVILEN